MAKCWLVDATLSLTKVQSIFFVRDARAGLVCEQHIRKGARNANEHLREGGNVRRIRVVNEYADVFFRNVILAQISIAFSVSHDETGYCLLLKPLTRIAYSDTCFQG